MTTIAFDGKTLAADTRLTLGYEVIQQHASKITIPEGCVFRNDKVTAIGVAGSISDQESFQAWLTAGADPKKYAAECGSISGIVITPNKSWVFYSGAGGKPVEVLGKHSIGSGSAYANAAMANGASAVDAIKTSIKLDAMTGGNIHHIAKTGVKITVLTPGGFS